jgi:hypothetical protein
MYFDNLFSNKIFKLIISLIIIVILLIIYYKKKNDFNFVFSFRNVLFMNNIIYEYLERWFDLNDNNRSNIEISPIRNNLDNDSNLNNNNNSLNDQHGYSMLSTNEQNTYNRANNDVNLLGDSPSLLSM